MPRLTPDDLARLLDDEDVRQTKQPRPAEKPQRRGEDRPFRPTMRRNERDPFKCGRCRTFIGPTLSGGRHRNHCPFCLTSRHVDRSRPGDRSSPCRALMPAIGVAFRADGEQMVVHRCNGCGIERQNRVAADDDPVAVMRLQPVTLPVRSEMIRDEEEMVG